MDTVTCPHHPSCPGCPLLGLGAEEQLRNKQEMLGDALLPYAELRDAATAPIMGARKLVDYRVRAKLVAGGGRLGLYRAGTHELVDIPECRVLVPALRELANALRDALPDAVTGVDLRETDAGALVTLIVKRGASPEPLGALARELPARVAGVAGVALSFRDPDSPQLLGDEPQVVSGAAELPHRIDPEAPFHYAAHGAFTQVHPEQTARLQASVERSLEERLGGLGGRRLLELHAGSGSLGLRLAKRGARPTLVEAYRPAVERARKAALEQGLWLEALSDDAEAYCAGARERGERFDAILVNPPRRGLEARLREHIAALGAEALIYVSCSPPTFARDAAHLARLGYRTKRVTPFDMIPLSDAVELVAELARDVRPEPELLHADDELIALVKSGHEDVDGLLSRLRARGDAAEAVAVSSLEHGASGVCLFARRPEYVERLRAALISGEKLYLALARGVTHEKGSVKRGPKAERTRYVRRRVIAGHSFLQVRPEPGSPRQIAKHLASIGHPLIGDAQKGDARSNTFFWHRHGLDRQFLHLEKLRLEYGARSLELRAELAPDLAAVLESAEAQR